MQEHKTCPKSFSTELPFGRPALMHGVVLEKVYLFGRRRSEW